MIGVGGCLVFMVVLGIVYAVICFIDDKIDTDYDEVTEAKCKKCIHYDGCRRHGCDYNCKDYCTEEMLCGKGLNK